MGANPPPIGTPSPRCLGATGPLPGAQCPPRDGTAITRVWADPLVPSGESGRQAMFSGPRAPPLGPCLWPQEGGVPRGSGLGPRPRSQKIRHLGSSRRPGLACRWLPPCPLGLGWHR